MKIVYVGGPLRGDTAWDMEQNIRTAENLAMEVFAIGAYPVCVHSLGRFTEGRRELAMGGSLELLRRCDALILHPSWERSAGSEKERGLMLRLDRPVFYTLDALQVWLQNPEGVYPPVSEDPS